MTIIDYDDIQCWEPLLDAILSEIVPASLLEELTRTTHEFIDGGGDMLRDAVGTATLINHLCDSLKNHQVRLYHGSRLTTAELELVRSEGLLPLELTIRKPNLVDILKLHPYWNNVEGKLDEALAYFSNGHAEGREDGCVHACFSRQGLLKSCNHYFEYGAEVDGHIVHRLFGEDYQIALNLLKSYRKPVLISFLCTFQEAAEASNPWGIPKDNLYSLPGMLATAWAYKKSSPSFSTATTHDCAAARIKGGIARGQIEAIEIISDSDLEYESSHITIRSSKPEWLMLLSNIFI